MDLQLPLTQLTLTLTCRKPPLRSQDITSGKPDHGMERSLGRPHNALAAVRTWLCPACRKGPCWSSQPRGKHNIATNKRTAVLTPLGWEHPCLVEGFMMALPWPGPKECKPHLH